MLRASLILISSIYFIKFDKYGLLNERIDVLRCKFSFLNIFKLDIISFHEDHTYIHHH